MASLNVAIEMLSEHFEGHSILNEAICYEFLREAGVSTPSFVVLRENEPYLDNLDSIEVVVKGLSSKIIHKSELGGVQRVSNDASSISHAIKRIQTSYENKGVAENLEGFLIVEAVEQPHGVWSEFLVTVRHDPAFGMVLSFGFGGVLTEMINGLGDDLICHLISDQRGTWESRLRSLPWVKIAMGESRQSGFMKISELVQWLSGLLDTMELVQRKLAPLGVSIEELEMNPVSYGPSGLIPLDCLIRLGEFKALRPTLPVSALDALFHPKSTLVVGASAKRDNPGRVILKNLKNKSQYSGKILALHPSEKIIDGVACIESADLIDEPVDLAVITVPAIQADRFPATAVIGSLLDGNHVRMIILISGGFGEVGGGRELEIEIQEMLWKARDHDSQVVGLNGPNCLGVISRQSGVNTFFIPEEKMPLNGSQGSNIAWVSQSGAFLVSNLTRFYGEMTPAYAISVGNQMDLSVADYVEYFLEKSEIDVIGIYLEGLIAGDGIRLIRCLEKAIDRNKKIVIYMAGKTARGAQAAASHTASIAPDYKVCAQLIRAQGGLVASNLQELEDLVNLAALSDTRVRVEQGCFILSNAGFECSAALDAITDDFPMARLAAPAKETLLNRIPGGLTEGENPMDVTPQMRAEDLITLSSTILAQEEVGLLVVSLVPGTPALPTLEQDAEFGAFLDSLGRLAAGPKPVVFVIDSGPLYDEFVRQLIRRGHMTFRRIDQALKIVEKYFYANG